MWDWERASVPYQPIYRRRLVRRRLLTLLIIAAVAIPFVVYQHHRSAQSVGERVFDDVVSAISLRYFDSSYHGVQWRAVAQRYRPLVVHARTTAARYAALRSLLTQLHDSHTAVYSPDELQPRRDEHRHAVFGMSPDAALSGDAAVDWKTISPGVGYLRIRSFPNSIDAVLGAAMTDIGRNRAVILDLRGNPGGLVDSVDTVAGIFLPEGLLVSSGTRRYHFFGPQRFTATSAAGVAYHGRVVVLVDSNSRSGAESLARALQYYHRATLVGTRTAGKVLGVDVEIALADGGLLRVATLDMRAPDGQRLEGRGVIPDMKIADSRDQVDAAVVLLGDASASSAPEAAPAPCPVAVDAFWLDGIDPKRGYARFGVHLSDSGSGKYAIKLSVTGRQNREPLTVRVRYIDAQNLAATFLWPTRGPTGVAIAQVVDLERSVPLSCVAEARALTYRARPENDTSLTRGDPETFDDGDVVFATSEIVATALLEFELLEAARPKYPVAAHDDQIQGTAVVEVVVGAQGRVVDARI